MSKLTATPTVSAVIPVHNGATYVAQAIESVLVQTHAPVECIVVNDGSIDDTEEVVRQFGRSVTHVPQSQAGVSVARNRGVRIATGDYVAFLDHDDVWYPEKLERQLAKLQTEGAVLALCAVEVIDAAGKTLSIKRLWARADLVTGMLLFDGTETVSCSSTGVMRRDAFHSLGGFDPLLGMSADWDLLLRALLHGGVSYVDEPLARYRVHRTNMSLDVTAMERDMRRAFAKAFVDPRLPRPLFREKRRAYARMFRMLAGSYRDAGRPADALRTFAIALRHDPSLAAELIRRPS